MKITSKWNGGPVFIRVFGPRDTVYIIGRWETVLKFGESVSFNLPEGQLQLEIKQGGLFGPHIVRPGQIWNNADERVLNHNGELVVPDSGDVVQDVTADLDVTIRYMLFGNEKSERERIQRVFRFSGPAVQRRVNVDDIEIIRDARTKVEAIHGSYLPADGAMSLSGNVVVTFLLFSGQVSVGLGTGAASSGPRFTDTGRPYDPGSGQFKLVGGGRVTTPIDSEFFVSIEGTFLGPVT